MSLIAAYLDHLRVERRLAGHTLESYGRDLAALAAFADTSRRNLERPRPPGARRVRAAQQLARGQSPRSVARAVAAVRGFYRFLVLDRRLPAVPPTICSRRRHGLRCRSSCRWRTWTPSWRSRTSSTPLGLRDRALIELLYATGMRVSELVGVRDADLHLDEHYLTCIGKGNKERLVPIGEQAAAWIRRYQSDARPG